MSSVQQACKNVDDIEEVNDEMWDPIAPAHVEQEHACDYINDPTSTV